MPAGRPHEGRGRYTRVVDRESGLAFIFAPDADAPDLLHIFARHATEPADAIDTFFEGADDTTWNRQRRRFETYSATHGLYWFWLEPGQVVMVISCFRLPGGLMTEHHRQLSDPEPYAIEHVDDERIRAMIEQAEHDIAERDDVRVNFRWSRHQVDTLKRAAALYDVPYQTYLKIVALRAAQDDLRRAGSEPNGDRGPTEPAVSTAEDDLVRKVMRRRQRRSGVGP